MSLPPCIVDVTVARAGRPRRRLWLPVFVLWPLLALLGLLALTVALLVDAVLRGVGPARLAVDGLGCRRASRRSRKTRGLRVSVKGERTTVDLVVK